MKTVQITLLIIVISASLALARNYEQRANEENLDLRQPLSDEFTHPHHEEKTIGMRHRKKRQHGPWNNYIQDYNQPWRGSYDTCPEREILSQMIKIMTLMLQKEHSVMPNVYVSCGKDFQPSSPVNPSVDNRGPALEDPHMNWGIYKDDNKKPIDHEQFTKRPLNLEPYRPQNDGADYNNDFTTKSPSISSVPRTIGGDQTAEAKPNICHFAYLACCDIVNPRNRHNCFTKLECGYYYVSDEKSCNSETKQKAFNFIVSTYKNELI